MPQNDGQAVEYSDPIQKSVFELINEFRKLGGGVKRDVSVEAYATTLARGNNGGDHTRHGLTALREMSWLPPAFGLADLFRPFILRADLKAEASSRPTKITRESDRNLTESPTAPKYLRPDELASDGSEPKKRSRRESNNASNALRNGESFKVEPSGIDDFAIVERSNRSTVCTCASYEWAAKLADLLNKAEASPIKQLALDMGRLGADFRFCFRSNCIRQSANVGSSTRSRIS
jgi:hypothetical protein